MLTAAFETPARSATSASVVRRLGCGDMILLDPCAELVQHTSHSCRFHATLPVLNPFSTFGGRAQRPGRGKNRSNNVVELSRRAALALLGIGAVGTALSWPRLTGSDIPGRRDDALTVALFGTQQDANARQALVEGFQRIHPDIK